MAYPYPSLPADFVDGTDAGDDTPGSTNIGPHADRHRKVDEALNDLKNELGSNPSGSAADVGARLSTIEAASSGDAAALTAHQADVALDGGPHGLPALTSDGLAWVRQGGALVAVNVATQAELDAHAAQQGTGLHIPSSGVTAAEVAAALKPSGSAAAATEALRALGTGSSQAAAGDDSRLPTPGQKNALAGLHGTPGAGNEYATKQSIGAAGTAGKALAADDPSTTNPRTPTSHTHPESDVTGLVGDLAAKAAQTDLDLRAPAIPNELGYKPAKIGKIISKGAPGSWNESYVEALKPFWDPASQRWGGVLVGYDTPFVGGFPSAGAKGKVGLYWSDDLVHWTPDAANPIFAGTGNTADWDGGTLTAPSMHVQDNGDGTYTYVLYYIGVPNYGWEASGAVGQHFKLGLATASAPAGPFTRSGSNPVISNTTGWRAKHIFHRSIVKKGSTYYLFFNASTTGDVESIGYATAPALTGPWTVQDANSPVLSGAGGAVWDNTYAADPSVFQARDGRWFMAYAGGGAGLNTQMGYAWTTDAEFPLNWRRHTANPFLLADRFYDGHLAGKSAIIHHGGRVYNFYCAKAQDDSDFSVALAIGGATPDPTWRVVREKPFNQGASIPVGKYLLQVNNAILLGGAGSGICAFRINPDDFAFGRAAKLKLRLNVITNAVAPGASYQLHLYKVNAIAGASTVAPAVTTLGASPIASTPVVTTPSGDGTSHPAESAEFDCPGDFYYVLVLEMTGGTTAANSRQAILTELLEKAG